MNRHLPTFLLLLLCNAPPSSSWAQDDVSDRIQRLRETYQTEVQKIRDESGRKRSELDRFYLEALGKLEQRLQEEGNLDDLVRVRGEREVFAKSSTFGPDDLQALKDLRPKLVESRDTVTAEETAELATLTEAYLKRLEPMQVALTKAGRIEDALALKSEVEKAKRILERGPSAAGPAADDTSFDPVPTFQPPLGPETLLETENWPAKVTLPAGNYRLQGKRYIKGNSDQELLFTAGSTFKGSGENPSLTLGTRVVLGKNLTFDDFALFGDLGSRFFFQDSTFTGMDLGKSGPWFGGRFMSRWQFRGCTFNGTFAKRWNSRHFGIQATGCTFERVEFVPIEYDKDDEPSDVALQAWATIQDSHFRKCTIPVSVLSLMENCTFDGCRFDDDPSPPTFAHEVKRTIYLANCTWRVKQLPARLVIEQKPLSAKP